MAGKKARTNPHRKMKYSSHNSKVIKHKDSKMKRRLSNLQKANPGNIYEIKNNKVGGKELTNIVLVKGRHPHKIKRVEAICG